MGGALLSLAGPAFALLAAAAASAQGTLPDNLGDFRALASALRKAGPGKDTSVVLEYRTDRATNGCDRDQAESSTRLHGDGRIARVVTRSFAEAPDHGPGRFSGKLSKAGWDSVFSALAAMKWVEQGFLPPPGHSETISSVRLRHAGKEDAFSFAGALPPGQDLISSGLDAAGDLASQAKDTAWSLVLGAASPRVGKGGLQLGVVWSNRGRAPVRIRMPLAGKPPGCGTLELTVSLPSDIHRLPPRSVPTSAGAWKELAPGDSLRLPAAFPVPPGKGPRSGRLAHLGLDVAEAGRDTVAATLFSAPFGF